MGNRNSKFHAQHHPSDPRASLDLIKYVTRNKPPCTCDKCGPRLQENHRHNELDYDLLHLEYNIYDYKVFSTPQLTKVNTYEAMYLARQCIDYMGRAEEAMTERQQIALGKLRLVVQHRGWVEKLCLRNCHEYIKPKEMVQLLGLLDDLFFMGALNWGFRWAPNLHEQKANAFTAWRFRAGYAGVTFDPTVFAHVPDPKLRHRGIWPDTPKAKLQDRLSVLIHEAVHGFFQTWTCGRRGCKSWKENVGEGGHGRAWMLVAKKLEEVVPRLLGLEICLSTQNSYLLDFCKDRLPLPSVCDLLSFGFVDVTTGKPILPKYLQPWDPTDPVNIKLLRSKRLPNGRFNMEILKFSEWSVAIRHPEEPYGWLYTGELGLAGYQPMPPEEEDPPVQVADFEEGPPRSSDQEQSPVPYAGVEGERAGRRHGQEPPIDYADVESEAPGQVMVADCALEHPSAQRAVPPWVQSESAGDTDEIIFGPDSMSDFEEIALEE